VLGISSITNLAAGRAAAPLSHEEVLAAGRGLSSQLEGLVRGVLLGLP
jgi:purine nucleoside phosphorylase